MSPAEQFAPAHTIAEHQYQPDGQRLGTRCTNITCDWFVDAGTPFADMLDSFGAHVVAALTNTGHEIVKLPVGIPDDDGQVWFDDRDTRVDCTGRDGRTVHVKGREVSPRGLRRESLEGLAAARMAEGGA